MNAVQQTNLRQGWPRLLSIVMIPIILLALASTAEAGKPGGPAPKSADLWVQSYGDRPVYVVGQETIINVSAGSNDGNPAGSVKVTIALSSELALVRAGGGSVTCSGTSSISCSIGNMTGFQRVEFPVIVRPTTAGWPVVTTSIQSTTTDPYLGNSTHNWWFRIVEATPLPLNLGCHSGYVTCRAELNLPATTTLRLGLQAQEGFYGDLRMAVTPQYQAGPSASFDAVAVSGTVTQAEMTVTLPAGTYLMTISCCRGELRTKRQLTPQIGDPYSYRCLPRFGIVGGQCVPNGFRPIYTPDRSARTGSGYFSGSATAS